MGNSTSTVAAPAVLGIPELLEQILLDIDQVTLLHAQRVNKQWLATISQSPKLQEILFFRPIAPVPHYHVSSGPERTRGIAYKFNPLLLQHFGGPPFAKTTRENSPSPNPPVYVDTAYFFSHLPYGKESSETRTRHLSGNGIEKRSTEARIKAQQALMRHNASWRRMLISQPPPAGIHYVQIFSDQEGGREEHRGYVDGMRTAYQAPKPGSADAPRSGPGSLFSIRKGGNGLFEGGLRFGMFYDLLYHKMIEYRPDDRVQFYITWGAAPESGDPLQKGRSGVRESRRRRISESRLLESEISLRTGAHNGLDEPLAPRVEIMLEYMERTRRLKRHERDREMERKSASKWFRSEDFWLPDAVLKGQGMHRAL